eukprot:CAMPEP_0118873632 /NCGR_PEP_ID=MMETSP1163-20130328/15362_1 /TAXON_ID=124430 /ORGANISM="Phaeomonas parva, Strain CCMP2877" /LENGTH=306 /DNA_ID=CAMNT_0006808923 /DNA_START=46 /DNA_END=963 /DNA_ORIENTATION=+
MRIAPRVIMAAAAFAAGARGFHPPAVRSAIRAIPKARGGGRRFGGFAADDLPADAALPKLVVFDLDHTLWTPELYQLRKLPNYADAGPPGPVAGKDVRLFADAAAALKELAECARWSGAKVAVASRTNKANWAYSLLEQFDELRDLVEFTEIFPGDKTRHFQNLQAQSGVGYSDMIFFDDAKGGKYGNCEPVARLGVMSAHCPDGLTAEVWRGALEAFAGAKAAGEPTGVVLDAPALAPEKAHPAIIAKWIDEKGFGFVRVEGRKGDVFFHRTAVSPDVALAPGVKVMVRVAPGRDGREACASVEA